MIPLYHSFAGRRVLVFGGGRVGARRARLFDREAAVVVVSPTFGDRDFGDAALIRAAPGPDDVPEWIDRVDPTLVVAATDDRAVNRAIERAGQATGRLLNRADVSGPIDHPAVSVPAIARDGDVVAAVATGGRSPAVSAVLRERIADAIEGAGRMATLAAGLASDLEAADVEPPAARHRALRTVVRSTALWAAITRGDPEVDRLARDLLREALDEGASGR